jgi:hypothetical protein
MIVETGHHPIPSFDTPQDMGNIMEESPQMGLITEDGYPPVDHLAALGL